MTTGNWLLSDQFNCTQTLMLLAFKSGNAIDFPSNGNDVSNFWGLFSALFYVSFITALSH